MGIYVVMFLGVLKTLARALLVFGCLIIAFSLAFHVLLPLNLYPNDEDFFDVRLTLTYGTSAKEIAQTVFQRGASL